MYLTCRSSTSTLPLSISTTFSVAHSFLPLSFRDAICARTASHLFDYIIKSLLVHQLGVALTFRCSILPLFFLGSRTLSPFLFLRFTVSLAHRLILELSVTTRKCLDYPIDFNHLHSYRDATRLASQPLGIPSFPTHTNVFSIL